MKPGTTRLFCLSSLRAAAPVDASPAMHAFAAQNISFSGPFLTPRGKSVFVVEGGPFGVRNNDSGKLRRSDP